MTLRRQNDAVDSPWHAALRCAAVACVLLLATGCAEQQLLSQARQLSREGQWDAALGQLERGVLQWPENVAIRAQWLQAREQALLRHATQASSALDAGRLDAGRAHVDAAAAIAPHDPRVVALKEASERLAQEPAWADRIEAYLANGDVARAEFVLDEALEALPRSARLADLQRRIQASRHAGATDRLDALREQRPVSLDFRDAPLRLVLDAVTRYSGVNFAFDRDVRQDLRVTVLLQKGTLEQALDALTGAHQLAYRVTDPDTLLIYPATAEKLREHQEQVVRVFRPVSGDAKGAAAFLKSMLRIREPFVDERSNLVSLRDTPENIRLAERLMTLFDVPEPEVLLDVEVLEVNSTRLTELGIKFPDSISLTPLTQGNTGLTLGNAGALNRNSIGLGVSGLLINLKREVGDVSTLANPRLRARNREKAHVLIGDKIPIITTTTGSVGFVSESVNYLEVGLKLDVEPTVYPDDEVAIRVALEVSSIGSASKTNNGTLAYQIGTRNASTLLRLRDGETQLLAGLVSRDERSSSSRVPGLGDLPILGRLFSSQQDQGTRTELVLAITPRIVRNVRKLAAEEAKVWVGTETSPRLRRRPETARASSAPASAPGQPEPPEFVARAKEMGKETGNAPPAGGAQTPARAVSLLTLQWAGPQEAQAGQVFDLRLMASAGVGLRGMPLDVRFDPELLEAQDVVEGDWLRRDGERTAFQASVDKQLGRIRVAGMRASATEATDGGSVLVIHFKPRRPGDATIWIENAVPVALSGPAPAMESSAWSVSIK
jgi:general secretion pathway protein D